MSKKLTPSDYSELAKILDDNRNVKITDSHWNVFYDLMKRNSDEFERQDKLISPD